MILLGGGGGPEGVVNPQRVAAARQRGQWARETLDGEPVRVWLLGEFRVTVGNRGIGEEQWRLKKAASLIKLLAPLRPPFLECLADILQTLQTDNTSALETGARQSTYGTLLRPTTSVTPTEHTVAGSSLIPLPATSPSSGTPLWSTITKSRAPSRCSRSASRVSTPGDRVRLGNSLMKGGEPRHGDPGL